MTSIEALRSMEQYLEHADKRQAKIEHEIAQAKDGLRAVLSREAAAAYLGISTKTLFRLIQRGEGPPYQKNEGTSRSNNERVYFPFDQLRTWQEARTQYSSPAQREKLAEEAKRNELRRRMAELEAEHAALQRALRESGDRKILAFDALTDLLAPHSWLLDGDSLAGHVLAVEDATLERGEVVVMTVEEALLEDWADIRAHAQMAEAFREVLAQASRVVDSWHKRMALQEHAHRHGQNNSDLPIKKGDM